MKKEWGQDVLDRRNIKSQVAVSERYSKYERLKHQGGWSCGAEGDGGR